MLVDFSLLKTNRKLKEGSGINNLCKRDQSIVIVPILSENAKQLRNPTGQNVHIKVLRMKVLVVAPESVRSLFRVCQHH